jgi:hypothetical protein
LSVAARYRVTRNKELDAGMCPHVNELGQLIDIVAEIK